MWTGKRTSQQPSGLLREPSTHSATLYSSSHSSLTCSLHAWPRLALSIPKRLKEAQPRCLRLPSSL